MTATTGKPRHGRVLRWMYRSGHPNRLAATMNRVEAVMGSVGLGPERMVTLEVRGRRTGRLISLPLVVAEHQGTRYVVAMLGNGAGWVANVRAAGGRATIRHGHRQAMHLEEVDISLRAPILRRYLELAPGARAHIPVDRRAPLEAFERIAADYPVFRLRPDSTRADGRGEAPPARSAVSPEDALSAR
jgi:hypothetical protein